MVKSYFTRDVVKFDQVVLRVYRVAEQKEMTKKNDYYREHCEILGKQSECHRAYLRAIAANTVNTILCDIESTLSGKSNTLLEKKVLELWEKPY